MPLQSSDLNFSSQADILENFESLNSGQRGCYNLAFAPVKHEGGRYIDSYFDNALLLIGAKSDRTKKFCCCGMGNSVNPSGRCSMRHYCPRCAYGRFAKAWKVLEPFYNKGTFWFITVAFDGHVGFGTGVGQDMVVLWNAIQAGFRELLDQKLIRGALVAEELAIRHFLPLAVQPHAHAVVEAPDFNENALDALGESVLNHIRQAEDPVGLTVSTTAKLVEEEADYKRHLEYCYKPLNIHTAYVSAWEEKVDEQSREGASQLNNELEEFVLGFNVATFKRNMTRRMGNLFARNKNYLGRHQGASKSRKKLKRDC